jgi:hypothetical protein
VLCVCTCLFTVQLHCFFIYRIVSCMYNEYIVSIFRFLKLFLHNSRCFSPTVYLNALFLGKYCCSVCFGLFVLFCVSVYVPKIQFNALFLDKNCCSVCLFCFVLVAMSPKYNSMPFNVAKIVVVFVLFYLFYFVLVFMPPKYNSMPFFFGQKLL